MTRNCNIDFLVETFYKSHKYFRATILSIADMLSIKSWPIVVRLLHIQNICLNLPHNFSKFLLTPLRIILQLNYYNYVITRLNFLAKIVSCQRFFVLDELLRKHCRPHSLKLTISVFFAPLSSKLGVNIAILSFEGMALEPSIQNRISVFKPNPKIEIAYVNLNLNTTLSRSLSLTKKVSRISHIWMEYHVSLLFTLCCYTFLPFC